MRFRVLHRTRSTDETPVTESFNEIHFKSFNNESQSMGRFVLKGLGWDLLKRSFNSSHNLIEWIC